MSPELRESRAALILLAVAVLSVLIFGAVTLAQPGRLGHPRAEERAGPGGKARPRIGSRSTGFGQDLPNT